jgi:hypothetical protein
MIVLPRLGICRYHEWKQMSRYEQHILLELLSVEAEHRPEVS